MEERALEEELLSLKKANGAFTGRVQDLAELHVANREHSFKASCLPTCRVGFQSIGFGDDRIH